MPPPHAPLPVFGVVLSPACSNGTVGVGGVCDVTCGGGHVPNSGATACVCPDGEFEKPTVVVTLVSATATTLSSSGVLSFNQIVSGWGNTGSNTDALITASSEIRGIRGRVNKETVGAIMFGLANNYAGTGYASLDFAAYPSGALYALYEEGTGFNVGHTTYGIGDVFGVRVNSAGSVEYTVNGAVVHTSTRAVVYPLSAAFAGAGVEPDAFTDVAWTDGGGNVLMKSCSGN